MKVGFCLFAIFFCLEKISAQIGEDICVLPKVAGFCKNVGTTRYWYNAGIGNCEKFTYQCGGNKNNFLTENACGSACKKPQRICRLPKVVGPCKAAMPRYWYNVTSKKCEPFTYGGCAGNENRFLSAAECSRKCEPTVAENICLLPKKVGPCRAAFRRWFYDPEIQDCELFTYGGCQANQNNFQTKELCRAACRQPFRICNLPKVVGPCEAIIPRFYYDSSTGRCTPFDYGGCQGNENRFETPEECQALCGGAILDGK